MTTTSMAEDKSFGHAPNPNPLSRSSRIFRPENPTQTSIFSPLPPLHFAFESDASNFDSLSTDDNDHDGVYYDVDDGVGEVSFFTNLFFRSPEIEPDSDLTSARSEPIAQSNELDLELKLGLGIDVDSLSESVEERRDCEGFCVVGVESDCDDSDSGNGSLCNIDDDDDDDDGFGVATYFDRPHFCWENLEFNNRENNTENSGLEGRLDDGCGNNRRDIELSSIVTYDDYDNDDRFDDLFNQCLDGDHEDDHDHADYDVDEVEPSIDLDPEVTERDIQDTSHLFHSDHESEEPEFSIESETDEVDEYGTLEVLGMERELLLALDNFRREVHNVLTPETYETYFDEYAYVAIVREMEAWMNEWRANPPTAKSVMENLPTIRLPAETLEREICAICKDDILGGTEGKETVRQLPCLHYYHGDCILPWLKLHNTCPLCRYELPTDDPAYEHRKTEREGLHNDGTWV